MDSSSIPLLPTQAADPAVAQFSYQNNQYVIQSLQAGYSGDLIAPVAVPDLADVSVAVDFSIGGDLTGKYAFVGCRAASNYENNYEVEVHPDTGVVNIWKIEPQNATKLATVTDTTAVNIGNGNNRIEIRCVGNTITGIVNGQQVISAQDSTYTTGAAFIGAGKSSATTAQLLVGFDNLTVTDLTSGAVVQPTRRRPSQRRPRSSRHKPPDSRQRFRPRPAPPALGTTPTAGADTGAAVPITDPRVDPDGTLTDAFIISLTADPVPGHWPPTTILLLVISSTSPAV